MKISVLLLIYYSLLCLSECIINGPAQFARCEADLDCQDVCLSNYVLSTFKCMKELGICLCTTKYDEKASSICFRPDAPNSISEKCNENCNSIMAHAESTDARVCLSDRRKDNYFYRCTCFAKL